MESLMAYVVGIMFTAAFYMMLRRSIVKLTRGAPPLIAEGASAPAGMIADPLPQALILTAIVIAFGVLAFAVVLIRRAYEVVGTDDLDQMKDTDT